MILTRCFISPRGTEDLGDPLYTSRFGFLWWFWIPRLHTQHPDEQNPRIIRLIWLCFAAGIEIWGQESKCCWPVKNVDVKKN